MAVARALARRPEVLLLDEPLSALDARTRAAAARELGALLRESEAPALLVTHDFAEAAQLGDRVGVIDRGRVDPGGDRQPARGRAELRVRRRLHRRRGAHRDGAAGLTSGLTEVALDGGGTVMTHEAGAGRVAVSIYPVGDLDRARGRAAARARPRTGSRPR